MHSTKCLFVECQKKALGKDVFCRVPKNSTRQNTSLPSAKKGTRQRHILPCAEKQHLAKYIFAECQKKALDKDAALGKIHLCRVPEKRHSAKTNFVECFFCRVYFIWHSAKRHCNTPGVYHQLSNRFELKHDMSSGNQGVKIKST